MIQQLRIQNFKSLRDVTLDLQRVNLLIGPNNCGKTNVLKALKFFSDFLDDKYPNETGLNAVCYRESENDVNWPIAFRFGGYEHYDYSFGAVQVNGYIRVSDMPDYAIVVGTHPTPLEPPILYDGSLLDVSALDSKFFDLNAIYFVNEALLQMPADYERRSGNLPRTGIRYRKDLGKRGVGIESIHIGIDDNIERGELALIPMLVNPFRNIIIYRPDPTKLLGLYPIINEEDVAEDASNLVAFLQVMRNKYHSVYRRIEEDIQRFVPEFQAISFEIVEAAKNDPIRIAYPDKSFAKIGLFDKKGRTFWAEDLSEGILYFLSLLAIVHQPNPPKLLLLEEPETGIHPRRIREILDLIFELAEEKDIQVIMTTHSPLVVDRFSDIPESVFVLEKPENETIVKNLQRDIIEPMNEKFRAGGEEPIPYTEALGEHWAMGFLGGVPDEYL